MKPNKKYPQVITISGKMGAGKDTLATYIKEELEKVGLRVMIAHYSDLLKYILRTFFQWNGEKDEVGRGLLQHVGTDVIRKQYNEDFWVNFLGVMIHLFRDEWDCVLIPDARFENEIKLMKEWFGATSVQITRPDIPEELSIHTDHISENALNDYEFDMSVVNDGEMNDLRSAATKLARSIVLNKV